MAAADDQGEGGQLDGFRLHDDGVDVAFDVVDGDEGDAGGEAERLGVGDADEEGAHEAGADGDGDGGEVGEAGGGAVEGFADDGDDGAEVLAAGELGDDSTVAAVRVHLGGDDGGEDGLTVFDD